MIRPKVLLSMCLLALMLRVSAYKCRAKGQSCSPYHPARKYGPPGCCPGYDCKLDYDVSKYGKYGKYGRAKYLCYAKKTYILYDPPYANCSVKFKFPLPQPRGEEAFNEFYKPCEPLISAFSGLIYTPFCITDCNGTSREPLRYMRDSQFAVGVPVSEACVRKALPYIYPYPDGKIPYCKHLDGGQAAATQMSKSALHVLSACSGKHVTAGAFQFLKSDASKADNETCIVAEST